MSILSDLIQLREKYRVSGSDVLPLGALTRIIDYHIVAGDSAAPVPAPKADQLVRLALDMLEKMVSEQPKYLDMSDDAYGIQAQAFAQWQDERDALLLLLRAALANSLLDQFEWSRDLYPEMEQHA
jgi:hypothetical protein